MDDARLHVAQCSEKKGDNVEFQINHGGGKENSHSNESVSPFKITNKSGFLDTATEISTYPNSNIIKLSQEFFQTRQHSKSVKEEVM